MKRVMTKRALGYFLWGLVFAMILIVWKFPYESLQERLLATASAQLGVKFEITDMSPALPFGLKLAKCAVRTMEPESKPFFEEDQVRLRFKVLQLLRGNLAFTLRSQAYGGTLSASTPCPITTLPHHHRVPSPPCPITTMPHHHPAPSTPCPITTLSHHHHAPSPPCPITTLPTTHSI